jgi:pimeloyl-ACP methyl ester carboxylesterase
MSDMKRLAATVFLALAAQTGGLCLWGQAPVAVNGHGIFFDCRGDAAGPTVILLAGAGGTTAVWDKVQPAVSRFAKVCSYDRAGLGRSRPIDKPQSADEIVDDLAGLPAVAHLSAPYILVGHSIGGIYARKFDERFDSEVAGMVFVDSSHEEQIWRFEKDQPSALSEYPNWKDRAAMEAKGFLPPRARLQWHFGKPLIVIEHGIPYEPVWHAMQQDLAARSQRGKLITATKSTHYIQKIEPGLVIESIRSVLAGSKSQVAPADERFR